MLCVSVACQYIGHCLRNSCCVTTTDSDTDARLLAQRTRGAFRSLTRRAYIIVMPDSVVESHCPHPVW